MAVSILFHTINGIGLGHLARQIAIARQLRVIGSEDLYILFATSAENHDWLQNSKIPFYFLPSEPHYRYSWTINKNAVSTKTIRVSAPFGMNTAILKAIMRNHEWSAIVFDTYFPKELLRTASGENIKIFGFFDSNQCYRFHQPLIEAMASHHGTLLLGSDGKPSEKLTSILNVIHVGRVFREINPYDHDLIRRKYFPNKETFKIVCVQGGGGFDSKNSSYYRKHLHFSDIVLKALKNVVSYIPSLECIFVTGPYDKYIRSTNTMLPSFVKTVVFEDSLIALLASADLAISKCGYNAVSDSIAACCPTIFLPQIEETENQNLHVDDLVRNHAAISANHDPKRLEHLVSSMLRDKKQLDKIRKRLRAYNKRNGTKKAAEEILNILTICEKK